LDPVDTLFIGYMKQQTVKNSRPTWRISAQSTLRPEIDGFLAEMHD
jgi:hypothetical protein